MPLLEVFLLDYGEERCFAKLSVRYSLMWCYSCKQGRELPVLLGLYRESFQHAPCLSIHMLFPVRAAVDTGAEQECPPDQLPD